MKYLLQNFSNLARGLQDICAVSATAVWLQTFFPVSAHASEGTASPETLFLPGVNFAIYLLIMIYGYRKAAVPALKQRAFDVEAQLKKAEELLDAAEKDYETTLAHLENIAGEKDELLKRLENEGRQTAAAILQRTQENIRALQDDVSRRVHAEHSKAEAEIRYAVVRLATKKARTKLEAQLKPEEDQRLRHETIRSLFS